MEGYKTLKTNDSVEFEVVQGDKGPQASNIVLLGSAIEEIKSGSKTPETEEQAE